MRRILGWSKDREKNGMVLRTREAGLLQAIVVPSRFASMRPHHNH